MQHPQMDSSDSDGSIEEGRMDRSYIKGQSASEQKIFTAQLHKENLALDEAYEELFSKFGSALVSWPTFKRWWQKLASGSELAPPGRPSRAPSALPEQMEADVPSSSQNIPERSQRERDTKGRFVTIKDSCVFCEFPIYPVMGYGVLSCGHAFHWEANYANWLKDGPHRNCPKKDCSKARVIKRCAGCQEYLGVGSFETMCYCDGELGQNDLHADCLENYLANNKGICRRCGAPHPGFCSICQKIFALTTDGNVPLKVYRKCCHSYVHQTCWEKFPETKCAYGCTSFPGTLFLPTFSLCGVPKPVQNLPELGKPRGIIGGRPSGCQKPESFGKSRQCVLCDQQYVAGTFKCWLQCGHLVHVDQKFVEWITHNPEGPTDQYGYNDMAGCPKCGKEPFLTCGRCDEWVPNGLPQLQFQCTKPCCSECYHKILTEADGRCPLQNGNCKSAHTFCNLCCEFIAIVPDGVPNDYHRLAGVREPGTRCPYCKQSNHRDHYIDWVTRFNTKHCPFCRRSCGKPNYVIDLPHIQYYKPNFPLLKSSLSVTYLGKQYPLLKIDEFLRGFCLFCDKTIGFKMQAAVLRCCNAFFHVPHLEDWIKKIGSKCPNCASSFGSLDSSSSLSIIEAVSVVPDHQIESRNKIAGVKQCCKNLVTRFQLEHQGSFCADCDFCLDSYTLKTTHWLGWPERHCHTSCKWSGHLCVYCNCKISLGAQPVFLDCGHILHYTCFVSWALSNDTVFINTKQDTYRAEHVQDKYYYETNLHFPSIFECPCGYHQQIIRVLDYDYKEHNNTPEKKLSNWKIINAILEYRQANNLIPFIGTKVAHSDAKERWVCCLCGGDFLLDGQDAVTVCHEHSKNQIQVKVHNRCFRNWAKITHCANCDHILNYPRACTYCCVNVVIDEQYTPKGDTCKHFHPICYDSWLEERKRAEHKPCRICLEAQNNPTKCDLCTRTIDEHSLHFHYFCDNCFSHTHYGCLSQWSEKNTTCICCKSRSGITVAIKEMPDDGDCFYTACAAGYRNAGNPPFGRLGVNLRKWTYHFFGQLLRFNAYPKPTFADHNSFMTTMKYALLEHPDCDTLENFCTLMALAYDEVDQKGIKGKWGQNHDSYCVAMYLQRTIVIICLDVTQKEISARRNPPKWTDAYIQRRSMPLKLAIYFEDGLHLTMPLEPMTPFYELFSFHITATTPSGQIVTRNVHSPILLFYNGASHYDAFNFYRQHVHDESKLRPFDGSSIQIPACFL